MYRHAFSMLQICLLVPLQQCKHVKTALESAQLLAGSVERSTDGFAMLATCLEAANDEDALSLLQGLLAGLKITSSQVILRSISTAQQQAKYSSSPSPLLNVLHSYGQLPSELLDNLPGFERYDNFVLFQCGAFSTKVWRYFLAENRDFHQKVALAFRVTHTAAKNYIQRDDQVRKPRVVPLFGDFGFDLAPNSPDLFWAKTTIKVQTASGKEGKVHYTWSPAHTMYSRGNLCEKERVASLPDLNGKTVVDLYGGIGYWVYPYLFGGASRIFACDINPYSIEGMRKAAELNKISCTILNSPNNTRLAESTQLTILPFDNTLCRTTLEGIADIVSLGLLPHAKDGFAVALDVLNVDGGTMRIHEEVFISAGDKATKEAARLEWAIQTSKNIENLDRKQRKTIISHISRIKTLGKELEHLVADIKVLPG